MMMKRKILALLASILCLSMLLVSCGECKEHVDENADGICDECEAEIPVCTHTDADENNLCDTCGVAVVRVEVPTEISDLVVKPLPEGGALSDYLVTDKKDNDAVLVSAELAIDLDDVVAVYYRLDTALAYVETENNGETTYQLFDLRANKTVKTFTEVDEFTDRYYYFEIEDVYNGESTYSYYTYSGAAIAENVDEDDRCTDIPDVQNGVYYLTIGETVYAVDAEDGALLASGNKNTFVKRPEFINVVGDFGYVETDTAIYVYNLASEKLVDCVYSYQLPAADELDVFYLANGNILVQTVDALDENAQKYDFKEYGVKFDINYVLVDVTAKTVAAADFGYYISDVTPTEDMEDMLKPDIPNAVTAYAIKDGKLLNDEDEMLWMLVDNDLTVKAVMKGTLTAQNDMYRLVADNRFLTSFGYGASTYYGIVNENGELVTYVTQAAAMQLAQYGYYQVGAKYYNADMTLIVDLDKEGEEYDYVDSYEDYTILSRTVTPEGGTATTTYYFFDAKQGAPVAITGTVVDACDDYFVVKSQANNADTYTVYNANNEVVASNLAAAPVMSPYYFQGYMFEVVTDAANNVTKTYIILTADYVQPI